MPCRSCRVKSRHEKSPKAVCQNSQSASLLSDSGLVMYCQHEKSKKPPREMTAEANREFYLNASRF